MIGPAARIQQILTLLKTRILSQPISSEFLGKHAAVLGEGLSARFRLELT